MPSSPISRYADDIGDGSGVDNAIGDYSITPKSFKIAPAVGETFSVERMIVYIRDTGSFDADKYGNNITLTNGITIRVKTDIGGADTTHWDVTDNLPIKSNSGWKRLMHDELVSAYGIGDESVTYRYTFARDGSPIILEGDNGDELQIILNDNFTGLVEHCFRIGMKSIFNY